MSFLENQITNRRNFYRNRRNVIRRIFLIFFICLNIFIFYKIVIKTKINVPEVQLVGNNLLRTDPLIEKILNLGKSKNYFLNSTRDISRSLKSSFPILNEAVVRKYLYPHYKYVVIVKEKSLWAELSKCPYKDSGKKYLINYVAGDGELIGLEYLNKTLVPENLISVCFIGNSIPSKNHLKIVKEVSDFIVNNLDLKIKQFLITEKNDIEIYSGDDIRIKAGKIDDDLLERIKRLKGALQAIKERSYLIEYLDLTLENSAVFKKFEENKISKPKLNIFKRRKT